MVINTSEKLYRPIIKDGTHLANSKDSDGTYRASLLDNDTNQLAGQAKWEEVEIECENNTVESNSAIVALIGVGIFTIGMVASPYIKKGWNEFVVPNTKKIWFKITKKYPTEVSPKVSDIPNYMKNFGIYLDKYLNALENEKLTVELVGQLLSSIEELKSNTNDENININISLIQLTKIINLISQSTEFIAKNKNLNILEFKSYENNSNDSLENLSNVLKLQKQILEAA